MRPSKLKKIVPQRGTLDSFDGANYYGVSKDAMPEWRALQKAQEDNQYYPCLNNPYFYMDYDGAGVEVEEDGKVVYNRLLSDDDVEALCYGCPLIKQCYEFALANNESYGVWGGIDFGKKDDALF
jgi:hypothetical protein